MTKKTKVNALNYVASFAYVNLWLGLFYSAVYLVGKLFKCPPSPRFSRHRCTPELIMHYKNGYALLDEKYLLIIVMVFIASLLALLFIKMFVATAKRPWHGLNNSAWLVAMLIYIGLSFVGWLYLLA